MLRTIIISPDAEMGQRLEAVVHGIGDEVQMLRRLDTYPGSVDLLRVLRAHAPDVVFLSFENLAQAVLIVRFLESQSNGLQIVAFNRICDASMLRETMRAGVREFLTDPFEQGAVIEALGNAQALLEKKPTEYTTTDHIVSFLPSKAGAGTTTLALNIAAALARQKTGRVALTDLDLNSGMLRFLLKLGAGNSVLEALENAAVMDEAMWSQLVSEAGESLDVLHAGQVNPNLRVEPAQIHSLIQFMRRNYDALVFDLSGNLERYSIEVMQESRNVYLVCTPEIPSLHLAREKLGFLKTLGLDTKVSLLLNRMQKRALFTPQQVEELVGLKIAATFSNDYFAVSRATTAGQMLDPESVIGKQCAEFALNNANLTGAAGPGERKKRFLEFFNVGANSQLSTQQ